MTDVNGVPIIKVPCVPYPPDASYKTIAIDCPRCGTFQCWRRYLSWEKANGITLNEKDHPAELDEDHMPARTVTIVAIAVELEPGQEVFEVSMCEPGIIRAVGFWLKQPKVLGSSTMRRTEVMPMPELFVECDRRSAMRRRRFAFIASNRELPVLDGYEVHYVGTAIRANEAGHLFEITEVPS